MSLKNLEKDTVARKLKELIKEKKVSPILAVPTEALKGLNPDSDEYKRAIGKSLTPVYVLKDNVSLYLQPSPERLEGDYIFPKDMLYLKSDGEYEIVAQSNAMNAFSVVDVNIDRIHDAVKKELDFKGIDIDIVDENFVKSVLAERGFDEKDIEEIMKAHGTYEQDRVHQIIKEENDIGQTTPLHDAIIYPTNNLRRPVKGTGHAETGHAEPINKSTPSLQPTAKEESYVPAPVPVNREPEKEVVVATAAIIANRMYEDGKDTITINELQNVANNARYLTEDQRAAAQYLADRYSEANLDNLSLDQLRDYADNIETIGGSEITDVSVEKTNETFDEILNSESRPLLPSDLDFGDAYGGERVRGFEGNG